MKRDGSHFGAGGRCADAIEKVAAASVRIEELRGPIEKSSRGERNSRRGPADTRGQEIEVIFAVNENGSGLADLADGASSFVRSRSVLRGAEEKSWREKQPGSRSGRCSRSKSEVMCISKEILDSKQLASRSGRYGRSKSEVMCDETQGTGALEEVETSVSSLARRGSMRCAGEEKKFGRDATHERKRPM